MSIRTGERAFHKTQLGVETTEGLAVPADILFPAESSSIIALDRAPITPAEDYGELADARPSRSSYGVRQATLPQRTVVRFEDFWLILEAALAGGVEPENPQAGVYVRKYIADNTADTLVSCTIEDGDNIAVYRMPGALVQRLRLSYDALAAGAAAPWNAEISWIGRDKELLGAFSAADPVADAMETALGQLTRLFYGSSATAFSSLAELAGSLVAFDLSIDTGVQFRKQGGTTDKVDSHGRGRIKCTFTALIEQTAETRSAVWDVFQSDAANPTIPDRRMRIAVLGAALAGNNARQTVTVAGSPPEGVDAQQTLSVTGTPTGGTFTLSYAADETGPIPFDATSEVVEDALTSLADIGAGNLLVTGAPGGPWLVTFQNDLGLAPIEPLSADGSELTPSGDIDVSDDTTVGVSPGSFTLTFGADTSDPIPWDASAAELQAALLRLAAIDADNGVVSGIAGGPWTVEFRNALGYRSVAALVADDAAMDPATVAVATSTPGVPAARKALVIDGRIEVDQLPVQESAGATRYSMQGRYVKDAGLGSVIELDLTNGVA